MPWLANDAASGPASCGAGASVTMPGSVLGLARGQDRDLVPVREEDHVARALGQRLIDLRDPDVADVAERRRQPRDGEVVGAGSP